MLAVILLEVIANDPQKEWLFYLQMDLPHCIQKFHTNFYAYLAESYLTPQVFRQF